LPDTISYKDYAKWRRCGINTALEKFHAKGFPLIKGVGSKLLADKRAVLLYELGLSDKDKTELLHNISAEIIKKEVFKNGKNS
jgi:hypothetical protein